MDSPDQVIHIIDELELIEIISFTSPVDVKTICGIKVPLQFAHTTPGKVTCPRCMELYKPPNEGLRIRDAYDARGNKLKWL